MKRFLSIVLTAAAVIWVAPTTPTAQAYPEPSVVSQSWNLDFEFEKPQPIAVTGVDGQRRWYWYMPYKVVNNSGDERLFLPEFVLATDNGQLIRAGKNVPASVYTTIKQSLKNPLLKSPIEVAGPLLQGEDYAEESVAIWPAWKGNPDEMTLFISGLSGETETITHPVTGEPVLLRRTRMIRYGLPGDPDSPKDQPLVPLEQKDVMR